MRLTFNAYIGGNYLKKEPLIPLSAHKCQSNVVYHHIWAAILNASFQRVPFVLKFNKQPFGYKWTTSYNSHFKVPSSEVITARQGSWVKVMFSQVFFCLLGSGYPWFHVLSEGWYLWSYVLSEGWYLWSYATYRGMGRYAWSQVPSGGWYVWGWVCPREVSTHPFCYWHLVVATTRKVSNRAVYIPLEWILFCLLCHRPKLVNSYINNCLGTCL